MMDLTLFDDSIIIKKNPKNFEENEFHMNEKEFIFCLGCSHTAGGKIQKKNQTWPYYLHEMLEKDFPKKYQVINFGIGGAGLYSLLVIFYDFLRSIDKHKLKKIKHIILQPPSYLRRPWIEKQKDFINEYTWFASKNIDEKIKNKEINLIDYLKIQESFAKNEMIILKKFIFDVLKSNLNIFLLILDYHKHNDYYHDKYYKNINQFCHDNNIKKYFTYLKKYEMNKHKDMGHLSDQGNMKLSQEIYEEFIKNLNFQGRIGSFISLLNS